MLRLFMAIVGFCALSQPVKAYDDLVVSLFEDVEIKKSSEHEAFNNKETDAEGKDLFSFFNFALPDRLFTDEYRAKTKNLTLQTMIKHADRGDLRAQMFIGYSYLYGENGLSTDYNKAFEYYTKAASQNDPVALNNLGSLYYGGIGVNRDTAKATQLFKKAADLGNYDAAVNIGFIYASGKGAKRNPELALKYFEMASSIDSPAAKYMLGYAYFHGKFRDKDYVKAAPLIKAAADSGFDEAQSMVADLYINGLGFPQNYTTGINYLTKSIQQGDIKSMMTLADILVEGKKYNKDPIYAHTLYNIASVRGAVGAAEKRNEVESKMKIDEITAAQKGASAYKEELSEMTLYIRNTYGKKIGSYLD